MHMLQRLVWSNNTLLIMPLTSYCLHGNKSI